MNHSSRPRLLLTTNYSTLYLPNLLLLKRFQMLNLRRRDESLVILDQLDQTFLTCFVELTEDIVEKEDWLFV